MKREQKYLCLLSAALIAAPLVFGAGPVFAQAGEAGASRLGNGKCRHDRLSAHNQSFLTGNR